MSRSVLRFAAEASAPLDRRFFARHAEACLAQLAPLTPVETDSAIQRQWAALINPAAGRGQGAQVWQGISPRLPQLGIRCHHRFTQHPRHASELIPQFLASGTRHFLIIGGDGSLHGAVNAIFAQTAVDPASVTLALVPVGSGNDWARTFGIPADHERAISLLCNGTIFRHDVGRIYCQGGAGEISCCFINMCGLGFDADVAKKISHDALSGIFRGMKYRYHLVSSLLGSRHRNMTFTIDGTEHVHPVFTLAVGIGRYNGGGMKQLPFALQDDGLLDLTAVRRISRLKVIRHLGKLYDGSFVRLPEVFTCRGKSIRIRSDPASWIEADGELVGTTPARFEILPRALNLVVGRARPL